MDVNLPAFEPAVARWFERAFAAPTTAQLLGWAEISGNRHTLIEAPTGSGKTLAAFLWCLNDLIARPPKTAGVSVLYVSPLKALNNDVRRNLEMPLAGIRDVAAELGLPEPSISVDVRTGDTLPSLRVKQIKRPPDVLITTPESLYLLLTARSSRAMFSCLRYVIVDEIHALAGNKRGVHLALSLERLEELQTRGRDSFTRIGLSATQRPLEAVARLLGGYGDDGEARPVSPVRAEQDKQIEVDVVYPFADSGEQGDFMKHTARLILEEMSQHRSMLVFCNARHTCERLAEVVNQLAGRQVALAHHGSIARERRFEIEQDLKEGRLPLLIATSSLELGIDIGSVDFVIQVGSPRSVNRALQRVGRSGHAVGAVSRGRIVARFPSDLLDAAACVQGVRQRQIEPAHVPHQCLDVLAQHIVAMAGWRSWRVEDVLRLARRSEPFRKLSRAQLENVLAMLDGRYADVRYSELKPRLAWDEEAGEVHPRPGALRTALLNGGTIPDRGYFSVELAGGEEGQRGKKLGELDEEFASELYVGGRPVFALGTSVWGVEAVDRDRVLVRPAPGEMFQIPFWRGERLDRPMEYPVGRLARQISSLLRQDEETAACWLKAECGLSPTAAAALVAYVGEQQEATGQVPSDRAIVLESFHDEIGDGRLVIHSLFGGRVNGAWAFALRPRLREALGGIDPLVLYNDDGIILRLPPMDHRPPINILDEVRADSVEELLIGELADAPMLALRFREAAQRALLLPKARPGHRTPLWLRRQRAADLLSIVRRKAGFPVLQEAVRECLHDTWDLNGLRSVLRGIESGEIALSFRETRSPSPFAASLVWEFGVAFQEQGDVPRGECRAAYLALNRDLLRETLESEDLRELIHPRALSELEAHLQQQAGNAEHQAEVVRLRARARGANSAQRDEVLQQRLRLELRFLGPLSASAIAQRLHLDPTWTERELDLMVEASQLCRGEYRPGGRGIEYCTPANLTRLHRDSLRLAREEVAPVNGERFAAFLQQWQGVGSGSPALRPRQILRSLLHLPLKRSLWQAVLTARFGEGAIELADSVTGRGELTWRGAGADRLELVENSAPARSADCRVPSAELSGDQIRDLLVQRGALFTSEIVRRLAPQGLTHHVVEQALAELEASGEVSNDLFSGAGRWSLNDSAGGRVPGAEDEWLPSRHSALGTGRLPFRHPALAEAYASALLARYGVVAPEMCRSERYGLRWGELERLLTSWEWRGRVLRGNFVGDLSGPQFAVREAVELLRQHGRDNPVGGGTPAALSGTNNLALLAWEDPANPWGKLLPHRAPRGQGRFVLLFGGRPVLFASGWGQELQPGVAWQESMALPAAEMLRRLGLCRPEGRVSVGRWQSGSVLVSPMAEPLREAGFRRWGLQLTYRRPPERRDGLDLAV